MDNKIIDINEIENKVSLLKKTGKKIVTTNGAFDLLHVGHVRCLQFAKKQGDILVVGLNSDNSIKKFKSEKRPIIPESERAELLASLSCVDFVVIFEEETPLNFLNKIKSDIHVKGIEYKKNLLEKSTVEKNNGKIIFRDRNKNEATTTNIIKTIISKYGEKDES